jgi:hypothetical protein
MTMRNDDIGQVVNYLLANKGKFLGAAEELADEVGIPLDRLRGVLNEVRTPEFIDENSWTIPYVKRGSDTNVWQIVDTDGRTDPVTMRISQHRRAVEMLGTTRRNMAQCKLALLPLRKSTRTAKLWKRTLVMQQATEQHLEALIENLDGQA